MIYELIQEAARYRRLLGVPQYEVARRMGTTQSHVSDIERKNTEPGYGVLERYFKAVGMRLVLVPLPTGAGLCSSKHSDGMTVCQCQLREGHETHVAGDRTWLSGSDSELIHSRTPVGVRMAELEVGDLENHLRAA